MLQKKMTVVHIIESLERGGAQVRLLNDLTFLRSRPFRHIVFSLAGKSDLAEPLRSCGATVHLLGGVPWLKKLGMVCTAIRKEKADIIHTQLFFADILGRIANICAGARPARVITTVQSSVYEPDNTFLYSGKRRLVDGLTGRACNAKFIAVSEFVKQSVITRLGISPKKVVVIPNYVDFHSLDNIDRDALVTFRKEMGIAIGQKVLITVGRLNPGKGIEYLLAAYKNILAHHPSTLLLIVGDGPSRPTLERLAVEYGVASSVRFLGERNDVPELLHASDIFVFPTLSEGLPLSLMEAMSLGLPCAVSAIGPNMELVIDGKNGILFKAGDAREACTAIETLLRDDANAQDLGSRAKAFIRSHFDPETLVEKLAALYMETR